MRDTSRKKWPAILRLKGSRLLAWVATRQTPFFACVRALADAPGQRTNRSTPCTRNQLSETARSPPVSLAAQELQQKPHRISTGHNRGRNSRDGSRTRPQPRCTLVMRAMIHTARPSVSLVHTGNGERWFTARFPQRLEASRKNLDVHHLSARLLSSSLRQADGALRPSPVLSPLGRGMC